MTKQIAKFTSPDGKQVLTIECRPGKKGWHVKATLDGVDKVKGTKKAPNRTAQTGARETFADAGKAGSAFNALIAESVKRGWVRRAIASKNAFSAIPTASGFKASK